MNYFARKLKNLSLEPLPWAIYLILIKIVTKIRSAIYAKLLNAPALSLGKGSFIRGIQCISIGKNVFINDGLWMEAISTYHEQTFKPKIIIGNNVSFSKNVHIGCINLIDIGNGVLLGSNIYIADHNHGTYSGEKQSLPIEPPSKRMLYSKGSVIIEDNVWIGDNVVILGPSRIGAGSIVAANSVVKGNVAQLTMIAGVPAKPIKRFDLESKAWKRI